MATSFLESVKKRHPDGVYAGDEFGGGAGHDGSGLPTGKPQNFMFATGIECSNPIIGGAASIPPVPGQEIKPRVRRDQLEECGHYEHWKEDLHLVKDLGLNVLRYGFPIHRTYLGPGKYDWEFTDRAMREMKRLKIVPILDLMHFGLPDWIGDFQNPEMPILFADYAEAVAERYKWARYYTPVNEIFITARGSAKDGIWNEQLRDDRAFVTALKHCVAASTLATHRICMHRNDAVIVQSESAEYLHVACASPNEEVELWNKLRFSSLDLLYAVPPDADVLMFLFDNGMTREEYDWKMVGEPPGYQIMGSDYYGRNERILLPDGTIGRAEDVLGWYQITHDYYMRYRKPVMHTETNHFNPDAAPAWLWKQWINVLRMRADGVPVLGFTWYSLTDQIDWDTALAQKNGTVNPCGLYDLDRKPRPVAGAYRQLLEEFGQITIVPRGEMFEVTDEPARLKVEV